MRTATAQASSEIRFHRPAEFRFESPEPAVVDMTVAEPLPSDNTLNQISGPSLIAAKWISVIERRIRESVSNDITNADEDGWLTLEIAARALSFFKATSDVLPPADPYLYTAMNGDLVAEFEGPHGKLTSVIGKSAVIAFAVVDDNVVKTTLSLPFEDVVKVRGELQRITEQLRSGEHGSVEA